MSIEFKKSPHPTLGVEVEIQLLDRETLDLKPITQSILQMASSDPDLLITSELIQAMVEIKTPICNTVKDVQESLEKQILKLRKLANAQGAEIAISGTHPFQAWWERKIYPSERYVKILEKFQWMARRLGTFGLHVHVGVRDGDRAITLMNSLIHYIPHLLALSTSSPFWGGKDTGLSSSRVAVFESMPTGGLPYFLVDWKEFQNCYDTLLRTGTIQSIKDIYWDIRPHFDFGTIEIRICDGISTLKETLAIVALVQCLVVWLDDQYQKGKRSHTIHMHRYWLAPENKWQAARYGLEGNIVNPDTQERHPIKEEMLKLLEILKPVALTLKCEEELSWVQDILHQESGAVRQRRVYYQTHSLKSVVQSLIQELQENRPMAREEITNSL